MIIERIRLEDVSVSPASGAHVATVLLETAKTSVSLRASALAMPSEGTEEVGDTAIARALAEDALRQLRRLPLYRLSGRDVTIDERAWPSATFKTPILS